MGKAAAIIPGRTARSHAVVAGVITGVLLLGLAPPARAVLLYDVDFEAPVHTLGQPPTLGQGPAPRNTVTSINFGHPIIAQEAGVLDGQFLRLSGSDYQQIEFGLGSDDGGFAQQYPYYRIMTDLVVQYLEPDRQFRYFVDGPHAHNVRFTSQGETVAVALTSEGYEEPIGTYEFGARMSLDVRIDRTIERWVIRIDDEVVFVGDYPILYNPQMRSVRPALDGPGTVDLDNVRIWGLPEPASLLVLAIGALCVAGRPLHRRRES